MSGPEHYRAAEHLLDRLYAGYTPDAAPILAEAQVHATLALAAATALGGVLPDADAHQWYETTGCCPEQFEGDR